MTQHYTLLNELLIRLEADGFEIGIGKYIRLQELLKQLPEGLESQELKPYLSPLFAQSVQQQERFSILFREALETAKLLEESPSDLGSQVLVDPQKPAFWRWVLGAALALALLVVGIFLFQSQDPPCGESLFQDPIQKDVYVSDTLLICDLLPPVTAFIKSFEAGGNGVASPFLIL